MAEIRTVPSHSAGFPVRAVRVSVTTGPDVGATTTATGDAITVGTAQGNDLVLTDPKVSRYHLDLRPVADRIEVADRGSTNGTRIGPATIRASTASVAAGTTLGVGDTTLIVEDVGVVMLDLQGDEMVAGLVGRTPAMRQLIARVQKLAQSDVPVLILGESGTGKELIARAIHSLGPRAEQPFVAVDCAALTPTLFASELFGHERGAFTGADRIHVGAFERAHRGTLFLDELGELPDALQSALLGSLERRSLRRVGGSADIPFDVRVVSATNSDLRERVNQGSFRLDLYYRLAVVLLALPPLRERTDDLRPLIEHFLRETGSEVSVSSLFPRQAVSTMKAHTWPGNVRELRNVVMRALATGEEPDIDPVHQVRDRVRAAPDPIAAVLELPYKHARRTLLDHFEVQYLRTLLDKTGGNVRAAAREAKMDRSYLTELIKRHGIL